MYSNRLILLSLLSVLLLSLAACIGGQTPPSQFYMLEPIRGGEGGETAWGTDKLTIALAPVRIPQYLDRPQMVIAIDENAYRLSELNRWAERLDDNITRVLVQNLAWLVPADLVLLNSSNRAAHAKLRVSVNILEFHVNPQGQAKLSAQWHVARGEDMIMGRQATYQEPASSSDYGAMASALNECLNRLSRDIAEDLRQRAASS